MLNLASHLDIELMVNNWGEQHDEFRNVEKAP